MFGMNMLNKKVDRAVRAYKSMDVKRHHNNCKHSNAHN
jgi:hypothetical protein